MPRVELAQVTVFIPADLCELGPAFAEEALGRHVHQVKSQGVAHHQETRAAHADGREHRGQAQSPGQEESRRHGDSHDVVAKRPEEILLYHPDDGAAQAHRPDQGEQIVLHQDHLAGLFGDVGTGAHGYPHVGFGERQGVVDAVADHGRGAPGLNGRDRPGFVPGEHPGAEVRDVDRLGGVSGAVNVVARQHERSYAVPVQENHGLGAVLPDLVPDGEDPERLLFGSEQEDRAAFPGRFLAERGDVL